MANCKAVAVPKALVGNLFGPEAISHNVYNHILLSPTQVSRNLSLPPNQASGLIGGRSRVGDRVIENFNSFADPITASKPKPKEDGLQFSTSTSTSCYFEDFASNEETLRVEEPHKKVFTITNSEAACLSPSNDEDEIHLDDKEEDEIPQDECDCASQDDTDTVEDVDNQIHSVEDFIGLHLMYTSERSKTSSEQSTSQKSEDGQSCSVSVLQQLVQKTNEIIKHNRLLQQEIVTLKKDTSAQTKVLTKLLRRKQKRLQSSTKH